MDGESKGEEKETKFDSEFLDFYAKLEAGDEKAEVEANSVIRVFEFQDGEYYVAYGKNAEFIADEYFSTRDVLKLKGGKLPSVNLRPQKLRTILKDVLVERRLSAELYTKPAARGSVWKVAKKGSPGNLQGFENFLFNESGDEQMESSPVVMAFKVASEPNGQKIVGVAFVDATLRVMEVCEFVDDDKFTNFKSVVTQKGPKECLVNKDENERLMEILKDGNVAVTVTKAAGPKGAVDVTQDLKRLVGSTQAHFVLLECTHAMAALSSLIKYLELLRDDSGHGLFKLRPFDLAQFMRLDAAAVTALNLFPQASDSNKNMSLFGLLNKCKTASGTRLLSQWVKQPLLDVEQINRRLNYVELFCENTDLRQTVQDQSLKGAPDFDRLLKKFQQKSGSLENMVSLFKYVIRIPALIEALKGYEGPHAEMLNKEVIEKLQTVSKDLAQFEALVESTIDLEALERHEYLINPSFNEKLQELSQEKASLLRDIQKCRDDVAEDLGLDDKVKLIHHSPHGYHLRVSRKDEKFIRGKNKYPALETRKDGVRFTTMQLKKLSRRFEEINSEYSTASAEIAAKCMEIVASYSPVFDSLNAVLAEIDVLTSFAQVAANAPTPYVRPTMESMGSGVLELIACRHPCMEVQEQMSFIPNDVVMATGKSNVQVITGPNMGGKSTFIRQTGVIVLLAQIGCFVPCERATISVVDCILARVGAGDVQLKGVSTFMKEMLEASSILKSTTKDSLIIIDELGRGTSTYDGFGLAWAIAEHIAQNIRAFTLFATHFHELTALADTCPSVVNKHVTAHTTDTSITMLYKVNDGPCDRSFGIHVSELANFPPSVIAMAKRKAFELEDFGSQAANILPVSGKAEADPSGVCDMDEDTDEKGATKRVKTAPSSFSHQLETPKQLSKEDRAKMNQFLKAFAAVPVEELADRKTQRALQFEKESDEILGSLPPSLLQMASGSSQSQ